MGLVELRTEHRLPEWSSGFLRERGSALTRALSDPDRVISLDEEADSIHCWRLVLLAAAALPAEVQEPLEALHLLHAQIIERLERGGVADIAQDIDFLVRTILIDRLTRLTDAALDVISTPEPA